MQRPHEPMYVQSLSGRAQQSGSASEQAAGRALGFKLTCHVTQQSPTLDEWCFA